MAEDKTRVGVELTSVHGSQFGSRRRFWVEFLALRVAHDGCGSSGVDCICECLGRLYLASGAILVQAVGCKWVTRPKGTMGRGLAVNRIRLRG